ncbi:MAG: hypothetical protein U9Q06_03870 [Nanoarchaeota archaeon]|nr:hypothetical protein [Nanoarchaeota archaeon]
MRPEEEKPQEDKLTEEIDSLKSRIKNTEYDLANMFRGNALLKTKLSNSQKELEAKQVLLEKIKSQPASAENLQMIENELVKDENISQEQEKIIDELVEKEL